MTKTSKISEKVSICTDAEFWFASLVLSSLLLRGFFLFISCLPFSQFLSGNCALTDEGFFFLFFFKWNSDRRQQQCLHLHSRAARRIWDSASPKTLIAVCSNKPENKFTDVSVCVSVCVFSEVNVNKLHRCSWFHEMRVFTKEQKQSNADSNIPRVLGMFVLVQKELMPL